MNLEEIVEAYLVESEEFLRDMETILLKTEKSKPSAEDLNAIFRAVHTIKGTAGMFGFQETVQFTHILENFLDSLRSNHIAFSTSMTDGLLQAKDFLSYLVLEEHKGNLSKEKLDFGQNILNLFKPYLENQSEKLTVDNPLSDMDSQTNRNPSSPKKTNSIVFQNYLISFRPNSNVFSEGLDPYSFIAYLKKIGKIVSLKTITENIPTYSKFLPETCYLGFEILFKSDAELEKVQKTFEFIERDSFLHIFPPGFGIEDLVDLSQQLPEEEIYLGNIWKEIGLLGDKEFLTYLELLKSIQFGSNFNSEPEIHTKETSSPEHHDSKQIGIDSNQQKTSTIKVDSKRIDNLINRVGELVVSSANMNQIISGIDDSNLQESSSQVIRLLNEVREISLKLRMIPIGEVFQKYQRTVRDLGKDLGKQIQLITEGNETELDRNIVDKLSDPLTHIIRNACDHGLETPNERRNLGKSEIGTIILRAYQEAGNVVIQIKDDGKGIQKSKVWEKGISKGICSGPLPHSDEEVFSLLFHPGFSTAEQVTNVSGRGVGLDVVQKNIEILRGSISISSTPNQGTSFTLRLPLTLAIIDGFLVGVANRRFILPMDIVLECLQFQDEEKENSSRYFPLRGSLIPYIRLSQIFPEETKDHSARENIVIVRNGEKKAGIVVDYLYGEYQTVVKPMGSVFRHVKGVSGSSILGDGQVALILDIPSLFERTIEIEKMSIE